MNAVTLAERLSALDVSVQARLLDLIRSLVARLGVAVVLVTHDTELAGRCGRVLRMSAGRLV